MNKKLFWCSPVTADVKIASVCQPLRRLLLYAELELNGCKEWLLIYFQGCSSWPLRKLSVTRLKQFKMYRGLEWVVHELASKATQWMAQLVTARGARSHLTYISSSSNGLALMVAIIQISFLNHRWELSWGRFYNYCMLWPINIADMLISQAGMGTKNQSLNIVKFLASYLWLVDSLMLS